MHYINYKANKKHFTEQKEELETKLSEPYIERDVEANIKSPLVKVILGPRRSGKSFYALHMLHSLGTFAYINFDDERILNIDRDEILHSALSFYKNPKTIFLDEIQNLDKWELFVNRLYRSNYNLFITGSNSHLLSSELASALTGRHTKILIFPFSFKEFLLWRFKKDLKDVSSHKIKSAFEKYLKDGGYPEPLVKELNYREYLSLLVDSILYKDISARYNIRYVSELRDLFYYVISNFSQQLSFRKLASYCTIGSVHTVRKYLFYLEEAFLIFPLRRFSWKVKEQLKAPPKYYAIDNGIIDSFSFKISPSYGWLLENLIAIKLRKYQMQNKIDIFYFLSNFGEIDFVIKKGNKVVMLLQVSYVSDIPPKKDLAPLLYASKLLKCNNLLFITKDIELEDTFSWHGVKRKIKFIPAWKFMLTKLF